MIPRLLIALLVGVLAVIFAPPSHAEAPPGAPLRAARIQLKGEALGRSETLEAAGIAEGAIVSPTLFGPLASRVEALYAARGYPKARVEIDATETDDPGSVVVSIEVYHFEGALRELGPGPPRVIARRAFVIDPGEDREVGELKQRYAATAGARADERVLEEADRGLADVLLREGFLRADVKHSVTDFQGFTYLYVFVEAGPRFEAVFDGNRAFDDDQLRIALGLEEARETKPQELVDKLRNFYVTRGFLDVEVGVVIRGSASEPVHYLAFTITEHTQVRVTRRVFPCLDKAFTADEIGSEIRSFLEEELPGGDAIAAGDQASVDAIFGPTKGAGGRARALVQNPAATYAPDTYERAAAHLRDLFESRGYLNAVVGPVTVERATCEPTSPPETCVPIATPPPPPLRCPSDPLGLPLPLDEVSEARTCVPDPKRHVTCAREVTVRIPIHLGPQTTLYDLSFEGARSFSERALAGVLELSLGEPLSNVAVEAARLRLLDVYREQGFAYAEVRALIDPSPDRTRARARFVIEEHEQVIVSGFVLRGATRTDHDLILGRLALEVDKPYRTSRVRASEERIATLGTFSSVTMGLEDAEIPAAKKRVIITVVEQLPQYLEPRIGFSTGDGLRFGFDYGHRNIGGQAISLNLSMQLSYLFDFMIIDPAVRQNYDAGDCGRDASGQVVCEPLQVIDRLEGRGTATVTFPEVGLGPLVSLSVDGLLVRDNQRDFGLTKRAFVPSLIYRPSRAISASLGASGELNDVQIFNADSVDEAIKKNQSLATLLRVPDGATFAVAQRIGATWDRRDNPFAAKSGTIISAGVEHVNAFPADSADPSTPDFTSHFLRITGRIAGYVRLTRGGSSIALSLAGGYNLQLDPNNPSSRTYPDRLFFLGGVDSLRAFLADSVVPEDIAQCILDPTRQASCKTLTINDVAIRGGDAMLNPRAELRVPYNDVLSLGLFLDMGNLWVDPAEIQIFSSRYAVGAGLRFATPIGPLALDYGINLDRRPWEDFGAFHFSIGLF